MTFNPTNPHIGFALAAGLVEAPLPRDVERRRQVFVTPELAEALKGRTLETGLPPFPIKALIGQFVTGGVLTIGWTRRQPRSARNRDRHPELERLEGNDEIWVLCQRRPRPGWRILGRFIGPDVLALLIARHKNDIGDNYQAAILDTISAWQARFDQLQAHTGSLISDYISGEFYDYDRPTR